MFRKSNIFLFIITFIFSATQLEKINLSEQFSKLNPQEKRIVQKSLESKNEPIAHSDPVKVFGNASIIILATEVNRVLSFINEINNYSEEKCHVLIASKGFGPNGELLSNILQERLNNKKIGVLSGPSFAQEVIDFKPKSILN